MREHLGEMRAVLHRERALGDGKAGRARRADPGIERQSAIDAEADYVQLFDSGRSTSLHLFEHVHGDSRDRGPAMIDLAQMYEKAGLYLGEGEMPDHLPVVLEYASTQPPAAARAFLGEIAHILNVVFNALAKRGSRYASALGALLELAGEEAAGRSACPRTSHSTKAGPNRPRSTAARRRVSRDPASRRRSNRPQRRPVEGART